MPGAYNTSAGSAEPLTSRPNERIKLLEKDVLCATMAVTTTMGVDLGFSWVFLGVFPFDFLSYSC